jgi:hypothetical protein
MPDAPDLLLDCEFTASHEIFDEASRQNLVESTRIVSLGLITWLKKVRLGYVVPDETQHTDYNPDNVVKVLAEHNAAIDKLVTDQSASFVPFGTGLDEADDGATRISTGLRCLDEPLGGGLARGESTLFIAATGVGKTVAATHLAAHFAGMGLRGLLITTEEKRKALELRIVSNRANIPYKRIREKFDERQLQSDELARYRAVRKQLETQLTIIEWLGDRSRSVREDLDIEVLKCAPVDFVILDWIGGALGSTTPELVRLAFQGAADKLAEIALRHNIICIGMAQAHPGQSRNKAKVDSTMLCECKTMGQRAANIIGMSGLRVIDEEGRESEILYRDKQYFYISKCRKSKGGLKPFIREFDYQRIRDV